MSSLRVTAGELRGRRVPVPPREVRPTSERARQAYFNIVGERIEGARFLDLFAGSGIFSFEAVSRGAASSTAVEQNKRYAAAIETLAAEWKAPVTVLAQDVFKALPKLGRFDLVYADPPYDFGRYEELVEAAGAAGGLVAVEHRRGVHLHGDTREYGEVAITFFSR
jgi:16S rRNA (guanine966-N2)-methyltransferase